MDFKRWRISLLPSAPLHLGGMEEGEWKRESVSVFRDEIISRARPPFYPLLAVPIKHSLFSPFLLFRS